MKNSFLKNTFVQLCPLFLFAFLSAGCTEEDLLSTALEITESPLYDFGTVATSSTVDQTFTITNSGVVAATNMSGLDLDAPFSFKGGVYPGTGGTCATSLEVGSSCDVVITFAPTTAGAASETLYIRYNNGVVNRLLELDLTGSGASGSGAVLTISDGPTYDFGSIVTGSSTNKTFTVTNTGAATATAMSGSGLAAPYSFSGGTYPGTGGTCGASLASGGSCTMVVDFSPVSVGASTDTVVLNYNDGSQSQSTNRNIQGTGTSGAVATLVISDGPYYDFGSVATGNSTTKTFTVSNTGTATATSLMGSGLAAPFSFFGGSYPGTGGTCAVTLAAAASCTLSVNFSPVSLGVFSDTINLDYNDGSAAQTANRAIQGTGI